MTIPARNEIHCDDEIIDYLYSQDQAHVFRFWDRLTQPQRDSLIKELISLSVERLEFLVGLARKGEEAAVQAMDFEPIPTLGIPQSEAELQDRREAERVGLEALGRGEVAIFLVAGGQGSRLGFDGPKGCYPITPIRKKPLFAVFAEKILRLERRLDRTLSWIVMTAPDNLQATRDFFEKHQGWGRGADSVRFITQEMWPTLFNDGRLLLETPWSLVMNPNGHGGSLAALEASGEAQRLHREGIRHLFYFQVDNPLVRIADPAFLGYHIGMNNQFSAKVVAKTQPDERVGVLGRINGKPGVIEYSDLPDALRNRRDGKGRLAFRAGNTAIHCLDLEFIRGLVSAGRGLPIHRAQKATSYLNEAGERVEPTGPNAMKMETFVFDAMQSAQRVLAMEVDRDCEFAPVKNAEGVDSPQSARRMLHTYYWEWLRRAGWPHPQPKKIEISPLWADDAETFIRRASGIDWESYRGNNYVYIDEAEV